MTRVRTLRAKLAALVARRRRDHDLGAEIGAHLAEAEEDYRRQGLSVEEARRAARRAFGSIPLVRDDYRDTGAFLWWDHLRRDLRQAARALRRTPLFAAIVVAVLAVGTGAVTTVESLLDTIVLRPLPYTDADRLVVVSHAAPGIRRASVGMSTGLYFHYRDHAASFESIALYDQGALNFRRADGSSERVQIVYCGYELFHVLGITPALGRMFTDADAAPGFADMTWQVPVLLAHDFWADRFGADPRVVGTLIHINDRDRRVIGILPAGFAFPTAHAEIYQLLQPTRASATMAGSFADDAVARLRPGATPASAQAELAAILPSVVGTWRDATAARLAHLRLAPTVEPLKSVIIGDIAPTLWTVFGSTVLLLAMAFASAATLLTARLEDRRGEMVVRAALGAGARHIASLFFLEALLLTLTAAGVGLVIARASLWAVLALVPTELPRAAEIRIDPFTWAFAVVAAVLMAAGYAALALRHQARSTSAPVLRASSRAATPLRHRRLDPWLVVQTALALVLMTGSALMVATNRNLSRTSLGFAPASVLTMEISLPYREADHYERVYQAVVDRLRTLPGVEDASAASFLPLTPGPDLYPVEAGSPPVAFKFFVPGYFQVMQTPILAGATFARGEEVVSPRPVLVSASLAGRLYPGQDPVGRPVTRLDHDGTPVTMGPAPIPPFTIAGVVGDVREVSLRGAPAEAVYVPAIAPHVEPSIMPTDMGIVIRSGLPPDDLAAEARAAVTGVDRFLTVSRVRTMDAIVRAASAPELFVSVVLIFAASISLTLGVVGVYGAVAEAVRRRTHEIGIRAALGADGLAIVSVVTASALRAVMAGSILGVAVAIVAAGSLRGLVFGVTPRDPATLAMATAALTMAALVAAWLAARRARSLSIVGALRHD